MVQTLTLPKIFSADPQLLEFGQDLTPDLGGEAVRVSQTGSRWSVAFSDFGNLSPRDARSLLARLAKAATLGDTVKAYFPQPEFDLATIGTPRVNGGGQTGSSLVIDGLPHSTSLDLEGRFFSVSVSSLSYLYMCTEDVTTDSSGNATLSIAPLLRASPLDNALLEFANPVVEGFAQHGGLGWTLQMLRWSKVPLTITERK